MQPEQFSSENHSQWSPTLNSVAWLTGGAIGVTLAFGVLPVYADPEIQIEAPAAVESAPAVPPVETSAEALLEPQVTASPAPDPAPALPALVIEQNPTPAAPIVESAPTAPTSEAEAPAEPFNNVFIDPTDYSLGATTSPDTPSLIFSDRSTGCQFSLQQGQSAPARSCASSSGAIADGGSQYDGGVTYGSPTDGEGAQFSVGPISIGGNSLTVGSTTVISREYFNERLRSLNLMRRGAEEFVFPLAVPAPISSLFGWRVHPIFGDRRFHTGTDLAAPEGTPVVATQDGEVHVADYLGGYGLTVILRHAEDSLETRYAHLSRILVRPGETIKQGEVVGLVGNTGNSTGPHLHFELRELTAQGWILLNPNELMGYAMANLNEAINNPLQALGLKDDKAQSGDQLDRDALDLPHRPAQPNAN